LRDHHLMALFCGPSSVRFRLPFVMSGREVNEAVARVAAAADNAPPRG